MAKELLGARLRKLREDKGMSRVEFAKRVGASPASVWNWESGTAPRGKAIAAIARVLGISEEFLTSGSGGQARSRGGEAGPASSATVARIMADARSEIAKASGFSQDQVKLSLQFALD